MNILSLIKEKKNVLCLEMIKILFSQEYNFQEEKIKPVNLDILPINQRGNRHMVRYTCYNTIHFKLNDKCTLLFLSNR